jgi:hypothetical protein
MIIQVIEKITKRSISYEKKCVSDKKAFTTEKEHALEPNDMFGLDRSRYSMEQLTIYIGGSILGWNSKFIQPQL